jgi:DNA-binding winged helix-turn-helix (wHTH) protein
MLSPVKDVVRFGSFELDLNVWQLRKGGIRVKIPLQPLQVLAMLLERPGVVVSREEPRQRLWPSDVFVDFDHGLNKNIQKLREALSDSSDSPRYIETIPRAGYRFIGTTDQLESPASEPDTQSTAPTAAMPADPITPHWLWRSRLFLGGAGCVVLLTPHGSFGIAMPQENRYRGSRILGR